jgi:hypothetical protein
VVIERIALFHDNQYLGHADGDIMAGILLIENRVETLSVKVKNKEDTTVYAQLMNAKVRINFDEEGQYAIVSCRGSVSVTGQSELGAKLDIAEIRQAFEEKTTQLVENAMSYIYETLAFDLFHLRWYMSQASNYEKANHFFDAELVPKIQVNCTLSMSG